MVTPEPYLVRIWWPYIWRPAINTFFEKKTSITKSFLLVPFATKFENGNIAIFKYSSKTHYCRLLILTAKLIYSINVQRIQVPSSFFKVLHWKKSTYRSILPLECTPFGVLLSHKTPAVDEHRLRLNGALRHFTNSTVWFCLRS